MKKQIVITLILIIVTAFVTVVYFKNLNPPGMRTSQVMHAIPGNASLIFEFNNDKSFYDIFSGNKLFASITGKQKLDELDTLRRQLIENAMLDKYFTGQNIYVSVHPSKVNDVNLLLTISSANGFELSILDQLSKAPNSGMVITPLRLQGKQGYNIYLNALKKRFYVINKESNIFLGSFSKELIEQCSVYKNQDNKPEYVLLSEQQNANSLANLYVNFNELSPLFDQLFKNKNTDIFKTLKLLPGLAALTLNYRSDALMFNGSTNILKDEGSGYLTLFTGQQPVINHLKDIFPATMAYSTSFAVSSPLKFASDLSKWHNSTGLKNEKNTLFSKIKAETGVSLKSEFNNLLGNEFAVITTRYFEKFAVVAVSDGSKLKLLLSAISTMTDENTGQLNYDKLPFFLLGDAFSTFKRPYFIIIDNYLVFANSTNELLSYNDIYINRKFLSKNSQYNQFDNLLAEKSNVAFLFDFKNLEPVLERDMYPDIYGEVKNNIPGWGNFYAASLQFTALDKNFNTNFCIRLNTDTINVKKPK
ncbi:MAG: hypothetical protein JWQ84_2601 [Mucilaginibacter sp.]|nr:hypothetical protein [Mucilaginibacter sp.]